MRTLNTIRTDLPDTIDLAGIILAEQNEELIKAGYIDNFSLLERLKIINYKNLLDSFLRHIGLAFVIFIGVMSFMNDSEAYEGEYDHIIGCVNSRTHETKEPITGLNNERGYAKCYWGGSGWQNITLNREVLRYYDDMKINATRKLDLLGISSIECGQKDGLCNRNNADIGPFQISRYAHKNEYYKSKKLMDLVGVRPYMIEYLYKYQMTWVKKRMDEYEDEGLCDTFFNNFRFKCQAVRHNGNKKIDLNGKQHRYNYADKGWEVRRYISDYLVERDLLFTN